MYLPYVKHTLNSWVTQNRIIPQDWKDLDTESWKLVLS